MSGGREQDKMLQQRPQIRGYLTVGDVLVVMHRSRVWFEKPLNFAVVTSKCLLLPSIPNQGLFASIGAMG